MDPQRESDAEGRDDASRHDAPWWLQPGPETCEVCLSAVQYQALYRCRACDRPLCLTCTVTIVERRIVLCPSCSEEGAR